MAECRVCKASTIWDGLCIDCMKYTHMMSKPVVPYVPKRRIINSKKKTFERDRIMERMMLKDKEPFSTPHKRNSFWQVVYTGDSMAKIKAEQSKRLFWNVPRSPEGKGSFFVGQVTTTPVQITRPKADKSGTYQIWEFKATTKVQLVNNGDLVALEFVIQDMNLGGAIKSKFPVIPGKVSDGPVGKFFGIFYDRTNSGGYYDADMYAASSVEEVLEDMNGEHLARMREILGDGPGIAEWRFSLTAYTPLLSGYLRDQGVTDDIPF